MKEQYSYYFAYGSNMDLRQMAHRCPDAIKVGPCQVTGYRFSIDSASVATIIPDTHSYVEGLLWQISERDLERLDMYEGVDHNCYCKEEITVSMPNGETLNALVYISKRREHLRGESTASSYMDNILRAAQREGLHKAYIDMLETLARN